MNNCFLSNCIILLSFLIFGCKHHLENSRFPLKFVKTDSLSFRRNYFYSKEMNDQEEEIYNSRNPEIDNTEDTSRKLVHLFKSMNLLDEHNDLILQNWERISSKPQKKIIFKHEIYNINIRDTLLYAEDKLIPKYNIIVSDSIGRVFASDFFDYFGTIPLNLTYYLSDLNHDGIDELITMETWYIVNGHNYDFSIFKLVK